MNNWLVNLSIRLKWNQIMNVRIFRVAEGWMNTQWMNMWIRLTWNSILKSRNAWGGRRLNEYSVCESVYQADMGWNIECWNIHSGRRFPQYSMGEYIDQTNIGSHIGIPEYSEWPKVKWILSYWVCQSRWNGIKYWMLEYSEWPQVELILNGWICRSG
jgi:hypothetical protein